MRRSFRLVGLLAIGWAAAGEMVHAQPADTAALGELIARARATSPEIHAARRLVQAAAARVPQAGALPDPMLSVGLMNVPVTSFDLRRDDMTMRLVQLAQRVPAPGTRGAREAVARASHQAALLDAQEVELGVITRLKEAYYEALFIDRALGILTRHRALLVDLAEVARARFALGRAPQQDVLRAQTEITRVDEQRAGLEARRTRATSEINGILQRSALEPLLPRYPAEVRALALAQPAPGAFTAAALTAGLGDDFPSLAGLQQRAIHERPALQAHGHRVAAARERVRLTERQRYPDIDVMLGYGMRQGRADMFNAGVSLPLPVYAARKQRLALTEVEHELAADELRHHQMVFEIEADIAARYAVLVRSREQIVLLREGVLPQAEATIEGAAAAYQGGRVEFMSLLDAQAVLFRNEIELARQLSDFGRALAALERAVGAELITEGLP